MKKTILMATMAVMMMGTTALAATPERATGCPVFASGSEVSYACGGGYHCGRYGRDGYGGCWDGNRGGYGCYRGGYDNSEN